MSAPRALGRGDQSMEGREFVVGLSMARRFEQNRTEQNRTKTVKVALKVLFPYQNVISVDYSHGKCGW